MNCRQLISFTQYSKIYLILYQICNSAESLLSNMDENVDPCNDFYEFACGGFVKKTKIPDDRPFINQHVIQNQELQKQLRQVLAKDILPNELKPFKLAKTLYKSCINESMFCTL